MNGDTRRLHLRFSMLRPEQKKAYEIISAIPPGQRIKYVCSLINRETHFQDLERHIIGAVSSALKDYNPSIHVPQKEIKTDEIRGDVMDFLNSLQAGGNKNI